MTLMIISKKIIHLDVTHVVYEAKGHGLDSDAFHNWLIGHKFRKRWYSWLSYGWEFSNHLDDVMIRLQWSEYFREPYAGDDAQLQQRFHNATSRNDVKITP